MDRSRYMPKLIVRSEKQGAQCGYDAYARVFRSSLDHRTHLVTCYTSDISDVTS